jgi:hypothetical protein
VLGWHARAAQAWALHRRQQLQPPSGAADAAADAVAARATGALGACASSSHGGQVLLLFDLATPLGRAELRRFAQVAAARATPGSMTAPPLAEVPP